MSCLTVCFIEPKQKKRSKMGEKEQRKESLDESNECRKYESFTQEKAQLRAEIDKKNMFHKASTTAGENLPQRLGSNTSEIRYELPQNQIDRDSLKRYPSSCSSAKRCASTSIMHEGYSMMDLWE